MAEQQKWIFFNDTKKNKYPNLAGCPKDEEIAVALSRNNTKCPLSRIVVSEANEGNFRLLHRLASAAYRRDDHSCRGFNFGIYCPPGQGKTFIVKRWAETIELPFVFVQSSSLKNTYHLFQLIEKELLQRKIPLVRKETGSYNYLLPPIIVFFDEAHEIPSDLQRGGLLNPMEADDGMMHVVEPGANGETFVVNCKDVCWVAATTDPADLFDAFRSRFLNHIEWQPASLEELPRMIFAGLTEKVVKGELPFAPPVEMCAKIAHYQQVPRLAIHSFGV